MDEKKIKVAMITNHLDITGISEVVMNYCKMLNREQFDLTIITGKPIAEKYQNECMHYNIKVCELPSRHQSPLFHYWKLWKKMFENRFEIIHVHGNSSMMSVELTLARMARIKIRIAHCHTSHCSNIRIHRFLNPYFKRTYTRALACGKMAGDWLYGKNNFEVLPNGCYTEQFVFASIQRTKMRRQLDLVDKFVIGHIGRFNESKNHPYLLDIFEKFAERRQDAVLLLVGIGPDYDNIRALVDAHPYKEQIILYGQSEDTPAMYSAMDMFVLPSKYEGFPVVLLEAQISGLPCFVSDKVSVEVDFGDIYWKSIEENPVVWVEEMLKIKSLKDEQRLEYARIHQEQIQKYDIRLAVQQLESIYGY